MDMSKASQGESGRRGRLPAPLSWDRADARKGRFDGKFILGVLSTGIYCLPSCAARPPRPENVRLFTTETQARAAGLRACKRCRPDLYYKGEDENVALFTGLAERVAAAPGAFADTAALSRVAGVSQTKLGDLLHDHAHLTPAAWLRRQRVRHAAGALLNSRAKVADIGFDAGFESESVFHRQFLAHMRMTPGAYRALGAADSFLLQLPPGYRAREILAYHARDPLGLSERSEGNRIWKALHTDDGPAILEITIGAAEAQVRVHADRKLSRTSMAALHVAALKVLALTNAIAPFESRHAQFIAPRRGLRMPLLPTGFDALCWGIIGQQIHVKFATALRREIVALAGAKIGDMHAHPTPDAVARLDVDDLARRRFSRSKARYLIEAAGSVASGALPLERLAEGSAIAAEQALTRQRGIGIWTARYVLMRGGFADAAPVGDSALATALQKLHGLTERPDAELTARLMAHYAPHRSLATMHLWTYLREAV
jgi:AraC family transcriptional regulator of adaptative response / DNA-3-methyladenine glycosylase II